MGDEMFRTFSFGGGVQSMTAIVILSLIICAAMLTAWARGEDVL